jgi:hypothetical protein
MDETTIDAIGCPSSARSWQREAEALRDLAAGGHLTVGQRERLLHEADAADRQADWWLDATVTG